MYVLIKNVLKVSQNAIFVDVSTNINIICEPNVDITGNQFEFCLPFTLHVMIVFFVKT